MAVHSASATRPLVVSRTRHGGPGRGLGERRRLSVRIRALPRGPCSGAWPVLGLDARDPRLADEPPLRARDGDDGFHVRHGVPARPRAAVRHDRAVARRHRYQRLRQFLHRGLRIEPLRRDGDHRVHCGLDVAIPVAARPHRIPCPSRRASRLFLCHQFLRTIPEPGVGRDTRRPVEPEPPAGRAHRTRTCGFGGTARICPGQARSTHAGATARSQVGLRLHRARNPHGALAAQDHQSLLQDVDHAAHQPGSSGRAAIAMAPTLAQLSQRPPHGRCRLPHLPGQRHGDGGSRPTDQPDAGHDELLHLRCIGHDPEPLARSCRGRHRGSRLVVGAVGDAPNAHPDPRIQGGHLGCHVHDPGELRRHSPHQGVRCCRPISATDGGGLGRRLQRGLQGASPDRDRHHRHVHGGGHVHGQRDLVHGLVGQP